MEELNSMTKEQMENELRLMRKKAVTSGILSGCAAVAAYRYHRHAERVGKKRMTLGTAGIFCWYWLWQVSIKNVVSNANHPWRQTHYYSVPQNDGC